MKRVRLSKLLSRFESDYPRIPIVANLSNFKRPEQPSASLTSAWKTLELLELSDVALETTSVPFSCLQCGKLNVNHPSVPSPSYKTGAFLVSSAGYVCLTCGHLQETDTNKTVMNYLEKLQDHAKYFQLSRNILAGATCAFLSVHQRVEPCDDITLVDCLLYAYLKSKLEAPAKPIIVDHFDVMFNSTDLNVVHQLVNLSRPGVSDQGALVRQSLRTIDECSLDFKSVCTMPAPDTSYPSSCCECRGGNFKSTLEGFVCIDCGEVCIDTVSDTLTFQQWEHHGPPLSINEDDKKDTRSTRYIRKQTINGYDTISSCVSRLQLPDQVESDAREFFIATRCVKPKISSTELASLPYDCLVYSYLVFVNARMDVKQASQPVYFICTCGCGQRFNSQQERQTHLDQKYSQACTLQTVVRLPRGDVDNLSKWLQQEGLGFPYFPAIKASVSLYLDNENLRECKEWVRTNRLVDDQLMDRLISYCQLSADPCNSLCWLRQSTFKTLVQCDCSDKAPVARCTCNLAAALYIVISKTMQMIAKNTSLSNAEIQRKYYI
jgi:hypothetical protein